MTPLALIGCGNMGSALVHGWLNVSNHDYQFTVVKPTPHFPDPVVQDNVQWSDNPYALTSHHGPVILAVKPAVIRRAVVDIKPYLKNGQSIISMAAGLTIAQYKQLLPDNPVTRIMPSLPAAQHQSLTPVFGEDVELVQKLFNPLGGTIVMDSDEAMDVATVILGCGPGYMAYWLEAIEDSAMAMGLDKKTSHQFVKAMSQASLGWLQGQHDYAEAASHLGRDGSMTASALRTLRERGIPDSMKAAMEAALRQAKLISENY